MHRNFTRLIALLLGVACAAWVLAQTPGAVSVVEAKSAHWSLLLDLVTAELDKPQANHAVIEALRPQIEKLQGEAAEGAAAAAMDAEALQPAPRRPGPCAGGW